MFLKDVISANTLFGGTESDQDRTNLKEDFLYFQNLTSRKQADITTQLQTHTTLTGKKKKR